MKRRKRSCHPAARMTLLQAFEAFYDKSDLSPNTEKLYRITLKNWGRLTGDPVVGDVTNETIAEYRAAALKVYAPDSVRSSWTIIRAVLRRLAEPLAGNPRGLGVIDFVPWMKPVRVVYNLPRRVSGDDLSRVYLACRVAQFPRNAGFPPAEWWRLLIVLAYFTGLRKSDLFALRLADVELEELELKFTAKKTGKQAIIPLHSAAAEHIRRLWGDRMRLFPDLAAKGGDYTTRWREIIDAAGVEQFTLHDLRRTAASEIERVRPGMGAVLLQHRQLGVTATSYLNQLAELREAVDGMRMPLAFAHGPRQGDRQEVKSRAERERMMRESVFRAPTKPDPSEWQFRDDGESQTFSQYSFRGQWRTLGRTQWRVLKILAAAPGAVDLQAVEAAVFDGRPMPADFSHRQGRVCAVISGLRKHLRIEFSLHTKWNPIPCVERGGGGRWSLLIPSSIGRTG